jgi:anaerobic selenocysteine-containing dehydrogenase
MPEKHTVYRVCPFCEATCGVSIEVEGRTILGVRGDKHDPFSRGYICPKAHALKQLYDDPDRLRRPIRRTATGWEEISWDDAYKEVASRILDIRKRYGDRSVGMYAGNPTIHDFAYLYGDVLARALPGRTFFNPAAVDQLPKVVSTGLMFGGPFPATCPIPDIDRTGFLLIVGANPAISHGSLMTMPDAPGRIKRVIERGGKVVVIDPRRTETAKIASEHHFIRPGTDAAFLLALVHTLFDEGLVTLGAATSIANGVDVVETIVREFAPEAVADFCGIPAATIRRIAREFSRSESAACYGRLGTCTQEFGTLSSWGVDLMNVLSGNLDRKGGVMFSDAVASRAILSKGKPFQFARWRSRVSGRPECGGQLPSSTMAEEILTEGDGQVRAMLLLMTNPLRSAANSSQLAEAFSRLDFVVAIDFYINETTRYANIILPTPSPAEQSHYEFALYELAVRNVAKWSSTAVPPEDGIPDSWQVLSRLSRHLMGMADKSDAEFDDMIFAQLAGAMVKRSNRWQGLTLDEIAQKVKGLGPERMIDMLIRIGPYGDGFGRQPDGLTLAKVRESDHGIDLGPLRPRLREVINTASGHIELAPPTMLDDIRRLKNTMASRDDRMVLIGRRVLSSANSFMHNLSIAVKGRDRCTLQISPQDVATYRLVDGGLARITSSVGTAVAPVEVTSDLMPGVVSLPHGFGHDVEESQMAVAKAHPGANINALTDNAAYDEASGTAVLSGTRVTIEPVAPASAGDCPNQQPPRHGPEIIG